MGFFKTIACVIAVVILVMAAYVMLGFFFSVLKFLGWIVIIVLLVLAVLAIYETFFSNNDDDWGV